MEKLKGSSRNVPSGAWSVARFLRDLASTKPAPGGGAAAALSAALGCALGSMVGRILLLRPQISARNRRRIQAHVKELNALCVKLTRLMTQDGQAYDRLVRAHRTRRGLAAARRQALRPPMAMCQASSEALKILKKLQPSAGPYLGSDLKAGGALLKGAFEAAWVTAQINVQFRNR